MNVEIVALNCQCLNGLKSLGLLIVMVMVMVTIKWSCHKSLGLLFNVKNQNWLGQ